MRSPLLPGALVVLPQQAAGGGGSTADGVPAQLIAYRQAVKKWLALTFDGETVFATEDSLQPLLESHLSGCSLVMGPKSDAELVVREIATELLATGYVQLATILPKEHLQEMAEVARGLDLVGKFHRLPIGIEEAYLGKGCVGKVCTVDATHPDTPSIVLKSEFAAQDRSIEMLGQMMGPSLEASFGIRLVGKTPLQLQMPFRDLEDTAKYVQHYPSEAEADTFLSDMGRRRLCILQFLGPGSGKLNLEPKVSTGTAVVTLTVQPNQLVAFLTHEYTHSVSGTSAEFAVLQTYFLEAPPEYKTTTVSGTLDILGSTAESPKPPSSMNVKVVSLASRDPCNADSEEKYWTAVRLAGCDGFLEIPHSRFDVDKYINYLDQQAAVMNGQSYCRHQGHLDGLELFDYTFFNIPAPEAKTMDPEQRVVLETTWGAMAGEGYELPKLRREGVHYGCFVGMSQSDWGAVSTECCRGQNTVNGIPETFIANRVNFLFNLKGPSFIQNTACSASLVATHNAKTNLLLPHDALEGCLAVGVSLNTGVGTWIGNCAGNMLSFVGRCFTFDGSADGYGRGEGSAALVMKKGKFSKDEGLPGIAATHVNSDGRSATITAPNGPAQQRLLRAIMMESGVKAGTVDVYEAHGTGTILGDPIENGALKKVLTVDRTMPLLTTCAKTNTGHMEGGAGISGFLKCCLMVMHGECCPNQHLRLLNPNLDQDGFDQQILSEGLTVRADAAVIGVSSFGYGGTNSHCQAYGTNTITSRGSAEKFLDKQVARKLFSAGPPHVDMTSLNWEEWQTDGVPHLTGSPDKVYDIELTKGNKAIWREVVQPEIGSFDGPFYVSGSFNEWQMLHMQANEEVLGHFAAEVTLEGSSLSFQIVLQQDTSLVLFPAEKSCSRKTVRVLGPETPPSRESAWLIQGSAGDEFTIELFITASDCNVTWFKRDSGPSMLRDENVEVVE